MWNGGRTYVIENAKLSTMSDEFFRNSKRRFLKVATIDSRRRKRYSKRINLTNLFYLTHVLGYDFVLG